MPSFPDTGRRRQQISLKHLFLSNKLYDVVTHKAAILTAVRIQKSRYGCSTQRGTRCGRSLLLGITHRILPIYAISSFVVSYMCKFEREYCWAIARALWRAYCRRWGSIVLE